MSFLSEGTSIFITRSFLRLILRLYVRARSSKRMCEWVEFPEKHTYCLTKMHKIVLIVLVHIYALEDNVVSCLL